ncbi:MAG: metal-dependent hydrolase [Chitinophagaceae bacterium]|nr:metal-dependent hydrolase [Chitinophagaceae bacterium]
MGEAFAGRTVGKKAMLWGMLAQSLPDIDFLSALWLKVPDALLAHRGFTHSILFCMVVAPFIAWLAWHLHRPHNISFKRWFFFISSVILIHIFLDAFNNYGVGWFEPFIHDRISFNGIYVADPFFSAPPGMSVLLLLLLRKKNTVRKWIWSLGLGVSFIYLGYCMSNKYYVSRNVKQILKSENIVYNRLLVTPAPLQSWLWFVVAENDSGYYTGYRSVFDNKATLDLHYFPRNDFLRSLVKDNKDLDKMIRFSQQFYTLEKHRDTILINDLRFGQIVGWQNPYEGFAFYYYLQPDIDNTLVVQRGRFAKWNKQSFHSLLKRIKGE